MHLMHLRCFFGRHVWERVEHFPDGDSVPDGYTVRKCERCGKVQWAFQSDLHRTDCTDPWINGWLHRRPKPNLPPPPQGGTGVQKPHRSVESFKVVCELDPGLWPEEQGKP